MSQATNIAGAVAPAATETATASHLRAAAHREGCSDCIGMGVVSLATLAALRVASALLGDAGLHGFAHWAQIALSLLDIAAGAGAILAGCLAFVHCIGLKNSSAVSEPRSPPSRRSRFESRPSPSAAD